MEPVHLADRAVIALSGPQARGFLQGLVTNNIESLAPGMGLYAALLTPQGKVLFDFFIAEGDGALLLDCAADSAPALVKRLTLYRLRSKVEIAPRPQLAVYAALEGHPANRDTPYAQRAVTFADPRHGDLPRRSIGAVAEMPTGLPGPGAYHELRLALGVPEAQDFGSDRMFALDADLDELNAVSFEKGCYVGQELTARMKHRGTARKRLLAISAAAPLPPPGSKITGSGNASLAEVGEIVAVYGEKGFALVRLDRLESGGEMLMAANIPVALNRPAWLSEA